jgi:hypothetical protein
MKRYTVFDSDFESLATQELGQSVCLTVSSFCFAFWLDIYKDTLLAESIPASTQAGLSYFQPTLLILAAVFAVGAIAFWVRKRSTIQKIKDDCKELEIEDERTLNTL